METRVSLHALSMPYRARSMAFDEAGTIGMERKGGLYPPSLVQPYDPRFHRP